MINLVYASSAARTMTPDDLADLLRQSRQSNERLDVTGMLAYKDGDFLQVLEGDESVVTELYAKILRDPRHTSAIRLLVDHVEERNFPNWSMGFQNFDVLGESDLATASSFVKEPFSARYFGENPAKAQKLLLSFRKNLR